MKKDGTYKDEEKTFAANILDKAKIAKSRNQIVLTDFLDMYKRKIAKETLEFSKEKNYIFYTKYEELEKAILVIFPEKYEKIIKEGQFDYSKAIKVIRITLPNESKEEYIHKDYLSAIMKLGIKREKVGDIIVFENGADIVVKSEICDYIFQNLRLLTRFKKSSLEIMRLEELRKPEIKTEERRITISSMRCDNIVAELVGCSRSEATEIVEAQRVFLNYSMEDKNSKTVNENDIIVIRGKGKFRIKEIQGETKKGKTALIVEHYI